MWKPIPFRLFLTASAAGITLLSLLPDTPDIPVAVPFLDKIEHALAYAVLAFFAVGSFRGRRSRVIFWSILACSAYGGLIEIMQIYTGRNAEAADFLFDGFGALSGGLLAGRWIRPPSRT